ncbi:hypothetical protein SDRG_03516 [Saprolegnia diclina VS20]|uniref:Uncharacterized protein n=1 Tax=Saprolegnia diclina (strain VS20) TaxID=1156394 RepID=T0QX98_SAPDV|nr:hypothetical protein SDRG_03516 [Saprolegnia diclina VS20]EQC39311.1 hypothetical protein SDRG_03516 [Saprolegnia diclina VS20]|eukprot:XP_008607372.1 hypothetical protein SDRG_03516 [Saprolegnia diclina VS20]
MLGPSPPTCAIIETRRHVVQLQHEMRGCLRDLEDLQERKARRACSSYMPKKKYASRLDKQKAELARIHATLERHAAWTAYNAKHSSLHALRTQAWKLRLDMANAQQQISNLGHEISILVVQYEACLPTLGAYEATIDRLFLTKLFAIIHTQAFAVSDKIIHTLNDACRVPAPSKHWHLSTYFPRQTEADNSVFYKITTPLHLRTAVEVADALWSIYRDLDGYEREFMGYLANPKYVYEDDDLAVVRCDLKAPNFGPIVLYKCFFRMRVNRDYYIHTVIFRNGLVDVWQSSTTRVYDGATPGASCRLETIGLFRVLNMVNWDRRSMESRRDEMIKMDALGSMRWAKDLPDNIVSRKGTWYYHEAPVPPQSPIFKTSSLVLKPFFPTKRDRRFAIILD